MGKSKTNSRNLSHIYEWKFDGNFKIKKKTEDNTDLFLSNLPHLKTQNLLCF